jgi:hypothetical protein
MSIKDSHAHAYAHTYARAVMQDVAHDFAFGDGSAADQTLGGRSSRKAITRGLNGGV